MRRKTYRPFKWDINFDNQNPQQEIEYIYFLDYDPDTERDILEELDYIAPSDEKYYELMIQKTELKHLSLPDYLS